VICRQGLFLGGEREARFLCKDALHGSKVTLLVDLDNLVIPRDSFDKGLACSSLKRQIVQAAIIIPVGKMNQAAAIKIEPQAALNVLDLTGKIG
jgi:predicted glycosyltransferase involved in capsule biosynthesis